MQVDCKHATPLASRAQVICALNSQAALLVHVESEKNGRRCLLFRHDRVFYALTKTELKSRFGGNLNRLAGLRITPLTRFAF